MNQNRNLTVTSFEQLQTYAMGQVVELPPFAEGMPFVARITRPSMIQMIRDGKFSNELLVSANELFVDSEAVSNAVTDKEKMNEFYDVLFAIVKESLLQPTYDEVKNAGLNLTDQQIMFIFNYVQHGVDSLASFRQE